ncbi:protein-L-isoaspartate O-methyltransferase family protein [Rivihabitans pingtungensis]|jgi:protein-L-isoaspartate(D-aspartate) O-methyltransferase|uniref:Protein-L-isoaspartate O-methyltransferase n=1 Tax=Rivihabitans pingtungensis TaxID=1054498 RepID=A0A318KN78_9NEIS|nr:protein-L-isoaspartate O-methyltransferase [Rivihabitans pingtungensis]MCK6436792.1 protein-L-isoaspartate O-methyltransferase [Rivihabitans pingtungensis]PXX79189.1 protein-L-isoaspartate(D-aspartate) O-methyltransferase [Rivihabitans pingtungensis]HNX71056.1 protein-L-isoaspartate O-methyltransferase [Rivihabitans pingtungensis]
MDFEKARFNMVEQQIRPWDVLNTQLLDLLFHVKRENFVADNQKAIAFVDTELPLPNGSRMLQPKMEARILQELNIAADEKILEIGTGSGYLTALLASVGKHVYSLDIDANMTALAKANLARAGIQNVTLVTANGVGGLPTNAPFDVIVVGGALPSVPEELTSQLAVGGRMLVVVGDLAPLAATLVERVKEGPSGLRSTVLFETHLDALQGVGQPERFVF